MKKHSCLALSFLFFFGAVHAQRLKQVKTIITKVNRHWQAEHPIPGNAFWHHSIYQIGNMEAYQITKDADFLSYSEKWAEQNKWMGAQSADPSKWKYSYGETDQYVLFGDWQACFQVYYDLYKLLPDEQKIARAKEVMSYQIATPNNDYWWWADGLYMAMPVMNDLYTITEDENYLKKQFEYFEYTKYLMYDTATGLFYRDAKYVYPKHKTNSGKKDFWSRGNGWAFAALAKVIAALPEGNEYRAEYVRVFQKMAVELKNSQQKEGYWTRSLLDPAQAPGYETSGTALFTYGLYWGIGNNILNKKHYLPVAKKAWSYLSKIALQPDGTIGYVQPIGERADQNPNTDERSTADFGVGVFLSASAELARYLD